MMGLPEKDVILDNDRVLNLIKQEDQTRVLALWTSAKDERVPVTCEFRPAVDGVVRWLRADAQFLRNAEGTVFRAVGVARDVTQRKLSEQRTEAARTAAEQRAERCEMMVREAGHRFMNSLNALKCMIDLQSTATQDGPCAMMLASLSSRVLALAEMHRALYCGQSGGETDLVSVSRRLADAAEALNPGILISISGPESLKLHGLLASHIGLCLQEIITNACKYAYPDTDGGVVGIEITECSSRIKITVRDHGVGVPSHIQSTQGMGLRIVREMVTECQGEFIVSSKPGEGTVICIDFPKIRPAAS